MPCLRLPQPWQFEGKPTLFAAQAGAEATRRWRPPEKV
jgi:hypothetical protein